MKPKFLFVPLLLISCFTTSCGNTLDLAEREIQIANTNYSSIDIQTLNRDIVFYYESTLLIHANLKFYDNYQDKISTEIRDGVLYVKETTTLSSFNIKDDQRKLYIKINDRAFINTSITNKNGSIDIEKVNADAMSISTSNGSIGLRSFAVSNATFSTSNGSITSSNLTSTSSISLTSSNGAISADNSTIPSLTIKTSNGAISSQDSSFDKGTFTTSSGSINIKEKSEEIIKNKIANYKVSLFTNAGSISLLGETLKERSYNNNIQNDDYFVLASTSLGSVTYGN